MRPWSNDHFGRSGKISSGSMVRWRCDRPVMPFADHYERAADFFLDGSRPLPFLLVRQPPSSFAPGSVWARRVLAGGPGAGAGQRLVMAENPVRHPGRWMADGRAASHACSTGGPARLECRSRRGGVERRPLRRGVGLPSQCSSFVPYERPAVNRSFIAFWENRLRRRGGSAILPAMQE